MQEELFQDFTVSTPWERCVADIEAALNSWKLIGLSELSKRPPAVVSGSRLPSLVKIQAVVQHKLQHRAEPYVLTLHLPHISANQTAKVKPTPPHAPALLWTASDSTAAADISWPGGSAAGWETQEGLHKLQRWFGVALFITLAPASYSRRILDEQEASSLLSALAVALSSTQVSWPAFLPVHDPYRDACWGIAVCGPSSTHFNSDSVRTSTLPERLLEVDGQLTLFSQQLAPHAPLAAAACLAAASDAGIASLASAAAGQPPAAYGPDVRVSVRKTYILPEQRNGGAEDSSQLEDPTTLWLDEWDEASSWRPWAAHADPLADLELDLDVLWTAVPAEAAVQEDCLNRNNATSWQLHALHAQTEAPAASGIFGSQASQPTRQHLRLPSSPDSSTSSFNIGLGASIAQPVELDGDEESDGSFTAMLTALARSRQAAVQARAIGQLAAPGWWAGQDVLVPPPAPPESVLQDVLRDLFQAPDLPSLFSRGFVALAEGSRGTAGGSATPPLLPALPGTTPCDSLLASLSLHALVFGNARAVAILWGRFVRELRFAQWEALVMLPRMPAHADNSTAKGDNPTAPWHPTPATQPLPHDPLASQQQHAQHDSTVAEGSAGAAVASTGGVSNADRLASSQRASGEPPTPDLHCCLLHQKLQMLNVCIHKRRSADQRLAQQLQSEAQESEAASRRHTPAAAGAPGSLPARATHSATALADSHLDGWEAFDMDNLDHAPAEPGAGHQQQHSSTPRKQRRVDADPTASPRSLYASCSEGGSPRADPDAEGAIDSAHNAAVPSDTVALQPAPGNRGGNPGPAAGSEPTAASMDLPLSTADVHLGFAEPGSTGGISAHQPAPLPDSHNTGLEGQWQGQIAGINGGPVQGLRELPRGVAKTLEGVSLLAAPHTLLNVPLTQEAPVWTEDMLWEREATMSALGDSEVAHALRKRLQGDILTSDIAAFKAANPGCVLEDFVRWHSPRDWVPDAAMPGGGRLSERMSHQGGLWRQLWEQTAARPAAEQKPLMDPELEGERVLHYLETLPPAAIWDQLLAVGLSTTLHLLGQSVGAQLPAAAQALHRFHKQASRVLQSPPCVQPSSAAMPRPHQDAALLDVAQLPALLQQFQCMEAIVVAGESLCLRLPGLHHVAAQLLDAAVEDAEAGPPDADTATGKRGKADSSWTDCHFDVRTPASNAAASTTASAAAPAHPNAPAIADGNLSTGDHALPLNGRSAAAHGHADPSPIHDSSPDAATSYARLSHQQTGSGSSTKRVHVEVQALADQACLDGLMHTKSTVSHALADTAGSAESQTSAQAGWPECLQTEWLLTCSHSRQEPGCPVVQRMLASSRLGHMRIATAIVTEP